MKQSDKRGIFTDLIPNLTVRISLRVYSTEPG